jgi:hypothetical protein
MPGMDKMRPFGNGPIGRGMGPCGSGLAFQLEKQKSWLEMQLAAIAQRLKGFE